MPKINQGRGVGTLKLLLIFCKASRIFFASLSAFSSETLFIVNTILVSEASTIICWRKASVSLMKSLSSLSLLWRSSFFGTLSLKVATNITLGLTLFPCKSLYSVEAILARDRIRSSLIVRLDVYFRMHFFSCGLTYSTSYLQFRASLRGKTMIKMEGPTAIAGKRSWNSGWPPESVK